MCIYLRGFLSQKKRKGEMNKLRVFIMSLSVVFMFGGIAYADVNDVLPNPACVSLKVKAVSRLCSAYMGCYAKAIKKTHNKRY